MSELPPPLPTLQYRTPDGSGLLSTPRAAFLFCLPGSVCWMIFLAGFAGFANYVLRGIFLPLWGISVITALISIPHFWRRPKRWYVIVCLCINIAGLLLSCVVLVLLAFLFAFGHH